MVFNKKTNNNKYVKTQPIFKIKQILQNKISNQTNTVKIQIPIL